MSRSLFLPILWQIALVPICVLPTFATAADPVRWRTDYQTARKEALEAGLPLCLQIGTEECYYCRRMEGTTLRDPGVTGMLGGQFIPLKLDGNREQALVRALKIQLYPTTVLAGPDGTIHAVIQGYVAAEPFRDQLKRTSVAAADDLKLMRELAEAITASKSGDYAKALATAQRIALVAKGKPAEAKASELLEDIEKIASERLAAANATGNKSGDSTARAVIAGVIRSFPGTRAAVRAEAQMAAAGASFETSVAGLPKPLLGIARELVEKGEYSDALNLLSYLARGPADSDEVKGANELIATIKSDVLKLTLAAKQASERAAAYQLALSDIHLASGNTTDAASCLEQVLRLCPNGQKAELALAKLTRIKSSTGAVPGTLQSQKRN